MTYSPPYQAWTSPPFPQQAIARFIGARGANIRAFQQLFPRLSIRLDYEKYNFTVTKLQRSLGRFRSQSNNEDSDRFEECKDLLLSVLLLIHKLFPNKLQNVLMDATDTTSLVWMPVPEYMIGVGIRFDVKPPVYILGCHNGSDTLSFPGALSSTFVGSGKYISQSVLTCKGLVHGQDLAAQQFIERHHEVMQYFQKRNQNIPKFKLACMIGYHVYGKEKIKGNLATALPLDADECAEPQRPFSLNAAMKAMESGAIRSKFICTLPPNWKERIEHAMDTVFDLPSVQMNHEKLSIKFRVNDQYASNLDVPLAYLPTFSFRGILEFDTMSGHYTPDPSGIYIECTPTCKVRYIPLACNATSMEVPIGSQIIQNVVESSEVASKKEWDMARSAFDEILTYINQNVKYFHDIGVIDETGKGETIPFLPWSIVDKLFSLIIRHELTTKARKGPVELKVKHVTPLVGFRENMVEQGEKKNMHVISSLTGTFVLLKHKLHHEHLAKATSDEERADVINRDLGDMIRILDGVTNHVNRMVNKTTDGGLEE